jgi:hypothetical protein
MRAALYASRKALDAVGCGGEKAGAGSSLPVRQFCSWLLLHFLCFELGSAWLPFFFSFFA